MSSRKSLTVPAAVKNKLDFLYEQARTAEQEPRWVTLDQALETLAESEDYSTEVDNDESDSSGRRRGITR